MQKWCQKDIRVRPKWIFFLLLTLDLNKAARASMLFHWPKFKMAVGTGYTMTTKQNKLPWASNSKMHKTSLWQSDLIAVYILFRYRLKYCSIQDSAGHNGFLTIISVPINAQSSVTTFRISVSIIGTHFKAKVEEYFLPWRAKIWTGTFQLDGHGLTWWNIPFMVLMLIRLKKQKKSLVSAHSFWLIVHREPCFIRHKTCISGICCSTPPPSHVEWKQASTLCSIFQGNLILLVSMSGH